VTASQRRVVGFVAVVLVVSCVGAIVAMYLRWEASMGSVRAPASLRPPGFAPGEFRQLPKIIAHFERDGVVVALSNPSRDDEVVLDPDTDRLVIEHDAVPGELTLQHFRRIPLDARSVLAPGETTEPVFIPIGASIRSVTVWFESRHPAGVLRMKATFP
jgi:hypothetical protein